MSSRFALLVAVISVLIVKAVSAHDPPAGSWLIDLPLQAVVLDAPWLSTTPRAEMSEKLAQGCCKICRKGKACGDSCISRAKTCLRPPGCACDAR